MDAQTGGMVAIAIAIFAHAIAWFFKSPKESAADMTKRMDMMETKHHALDMRFVIAETRLTTEMRHLSNTIERLITLIEGNGDEHARISGRHPITGG